MQGILIVEGPDKREPLLINVGTQTVTELNGSHVVRIPPTAMALVTLVKELVHAEIKKTYG